MNFTFENLRKFLEVVSHYRTWRFCDWNGEPGILLRHDIDLYLQPVEQIAALEAEAGVAATIFVMTTSDFYNVSSKQSRHLLRSLNDNGFEIGLHFDPTVYGAATTAELSGRAKDEARIIEDAIGTPVSSLSLHNPSIMNGIIQIDGFVNTYDPRYFIQDTYVSDSRHTFRRDPFDIIRQAESKVVQVLLHPFQYSENGGSYRDLFQAYAEHVIHTVDDDFAKNSAYVDELPEGLAPRLRWDTN